MKLPCLLLCLLLPLGQAAAETTIIHFDETKRGETPAGWTAGTTGGGQARWEIVPDPSAPSPPNVLKQSGVANFAWIARLNAGLRDGMVQTRFKPVSGREDQAGGLIWRMRDADNYYVCRANSLENNVVLYKTVAGQRSALSVKGATISGYGVKAQVPAKQWSTLRVEFKGNLFTVFFNERQLFQVEDSTFTQAGGVGLWTKADSVTLFDDFTFGTL